MAPHEHHAHLPHLGGHTHVLRGGLRDGQRVELTPGVTRLLAAAEAPGLLDVYELTDERLPDPHTHGGDIGVLDWAGQEPTGDRIAAELQQSPGDRPTA